MRKVWNINTKWAFTKMAEEAPAQMPQKWDWVHLPHTWNAIDAQDGGNDYYRGTAWYAREMDGTELPEGGRVYLEFLGANASADVWWNGEKLARHDGGYSTWRVDLTGRIRHSNLLSVCVDNGVSETVYPQMADFSFYGGLYRGVNLICVPESHFALMDSGGIGLKVTPVVEGTGARIEVECQVENRTGQSVRFCILDAQGEEVACVETQGSSAILPMENVHLWNGRKDPYLYTMRAELIENGEPIDCVSTRFGCRSFAIDPERGFVLNGQEYPLRGVSRHQDRWGVGNALLPEHHREDMDLICEMGANTIRLAHYQHDQVFYDLCDERGMVVWAEIPYISKHMPGGRENTLSQMRELITQNYNHPSIVVWGLSNEITLSGESDPDLLENHRLLNQMAHDMDKTRLTTVAAVSMCPADAEYLQIPDVLSYNHYFGWYGGDASMNGPWFDKFHAEHPDRAVGMSEYGCEALNWHTSRPIQGDYTEEYQAYYHEELIKQLFPRKFIWAAHVWNMFDFGADARSEGGENGQNHKGLVTIDRKYKKDSFYAYKAWLSEDPFVHLCGKRYVDRVEDVTRVTVYSNRPTVRLYANGVLLAEKSCPEHFFYFDVPNAGETRLTAVAGECTDTSVIRKVETFNEAYRLKEKGAVLNWFDITEPEGYFSLNDKMGDILACEAGREALAGIFAKLRAGSGKKGGIEMGEGILQMLNGFTVLRMLNMAGTMNVSFTREELLEINAKLNAIAK